MSLTIMGLTLGPLLHALLTFVLTVLLVVPVVWGLEFFFQL